MRLQAKLLLPDATMQSIVEQFLDVHSSRMKHVLLNWWRRVLLEIVIQKSHLTLKMTYWACEIRERWRESLILFHLWYRLNVRVHGGHGSESLWRATHIIISIHWQSYTYKLHYLFICPSLSYVVFCTKLCDCLFYSNDSSILFTPRIFNLLHSFQCIWLVYLLHTKPYFPQTKIHLTRSDVFLNILFVCLWM